jgi:peptidoglycan hydrolase CwlO-like protein
MAILLSSALSTETTALPDFVETFDSTLATIPVSVFANGSVVFVTASDGMSFGGFTIANVTDETFGDYVLIELHDDGTVPGDTPNDGYYAGNFTVVDDLGTNGLFTNDTTDTIDLMDGGVATITVDIDLQTDSGFAQITADFSPPNVTINSGPDTVDLAYTLNVTITDPNMDTGNVWYNVDGGPNIRLTYRGGNYYESLVDTSSLIEGPHTIRVEAVDQVLNSDSAQTVMITVDHPAPDISITVTHTPAEPKDGDTVTFTVEIENDGDGDADDVIVTLIVNGNDEAQQTENIPAGGTSTVELEWTATEGEYDIEVQLTGAGVDVGSTLEVFDIQPASQDLLDHPLFLPAIVVVVTIALVGGTIVYARIARDFARASATKAVPVEHAPAIPVGEKDPCEEIRRKWKAIQAEYERAKTEMDHAGQRADELRSKAEQAKSESAKADEKTEKANEDYVDGKKEMEDLKQKMHDFFDEGITGEGISIGYPSEGQHNQIGFFKDVVKIFFRSSEQHLIINKFLDENSEPIEELEKEHKETDETLTNLKYELASANRDAMEADSRAREAESRAIQAEQEYEALKHEVESLNERAEGFRQKWRICMLKRLDEAAERAESAAKGAAEAARRAKGILDKEEFQKTKEEVQAARENAGKAKEDSKGIKDKLKDEDFEEDTSEPVERIERAERDTLSAAKEVAAGAKFYQSRT